MILLLFYVLVGIFLAVSIGGSEEFWDSLDDEPFYVKIYAFCEVVLCWPYGVYLMFKE
jgi:hypothetical protein